MSSVLALLLFIVLATAVKLGVRRAFRGKRVAAPPSPARAGTGSRPRR